MKVIMDKLKIKAKNNKKILIFLFGLAAIGLISGSFFITFISEIDQQLIKDYILDFSNSITSNKLDYLDALKNTLLSNTIYVLITWLLGMSVIGIPIIVFMYFTKTFLIGFSISSFILTYKIKGLIFSIIYIIPSLINIIFFTILMVFSIKFSSKLTSSILKKENINFRTIFTKYSTFLGLTIVAIIITSLLEVFVVPFILKNLMFIVK